MERRYLEAEEREKERLKRVREWAEFVRDHKREEWAPQVNALADSQIIIAERFYRRLAGTKGGKEKVKRLIELRL
ncbi:MAG: hypothetical protein ACP5E4_02110, partial [Candidatus Aenigmatarchaeota archaeon]